MQLLQRVDFGGHELGPIYLLARIPVQLLIIAMTYFATSDRNPEHRDSTLHAHR